MRQNYGEKRDYRKIDIYWRKLYKASTTWAESCKEAKEAFLIKHNNLNQNEVKAFFANDKPC